MLRQLGDVVPIRVMRIDHDHRVVRRASAERAGARVPHAVFRLDELVVLFLLRVVRIVADEEVPFHRLVFGRHRVKGGDFVVFRQAVLADRPVTLQVLRIAPRFQQQDGVARLGKARGDDASPRARSDNDIFIDSRLRVHGSNSKNER
jgi:hypothetical protein